MIDAISNVYTAFSGRQAYLEGWTYAMTNMGVDPDTLGRQWWINDQLTGGTLPAAEARELAAQEGVAWLVLAKDWPGAPPAGMTPAYENEDVRDLPLLMTFTTAIQLGYNLDASGIQGSVILVSTDDSAKRKG